MADINKVFAEAQKLNWNIESLLRLSSFETYGDLSGLHIDYASSFSSLKNSGKSWKNFLP